MTGGASFAGEGDPEWVNLVPVAQYLRSYVLFTDPTYSETSLVIIRKASDDGSFADVELDCAGTLGGWLPLGAYEYTRVSLVTGNFESVGGCGNGRHTVSSKLPFGVTVWGWGTLGDISKSPTEQDVYTLYVSYGYPAGAGVRAINDVELPK